MSLIPGWLIFLVGAARLWLLVAIVKRIFTPGACVLVAGFVLQFGHPRAIMSNEYVTPGAYLLLLVSIAIGFVLILHDFLSSVVELDRPVVESFCAIRSRLVDAAFGARSRLLLRHFVLQLVVASFHIFYSRLLVASFRVVRSLLVVCLCRLVPFAYCWLLQLSKNMFSRCVHFCHWF